MLNVEVMVNVQIDNHVHIMDQQMVEVHIMCDEYVWIMHDYLSEHNVHDSVEIIHHVLHDSTVVLHEDEHGIHK